MSDRQYIRLKRENKTFFIQCLPMDRVELIKYRLQEFIDVDPNEMRLYIGDRLIDEKSTIHDQDLKNDCVIKVLIRKPGIGGGAGEWETLEVERVESASVESSPTKE